MFIPHLTSASRTAAVPVRVSLYQQQGEDPKFVLRDPHLPEVVATALGWPGFVCEINVLSGTGPAH